MLTIRQRTPSFTVLAPVCLVIFFTRNREQLPPVLLPLLDRDELAASSSQFVWAGHVQQVQLDQGRPNVKFPQHLQHPVLRALLQELLHQQRRKVAVHR
jgi:hypothetical protein